MKDDTTTSKKIQYQIKRFSSRITKDLSKPKKRFFQTPVFKQYAIADGIFRLLFNLKWNTEELEEETQDKRQLLFTFT